MALKERIEANLDDIPFANTKITKFALGKCNQYISEEHWNCDEEVNVFDIVGTIHPDYIGMTWWELINHGKRMHLNLPLVDKNPQYYDEPMVNPSMYFTKLEDKYYISIDGNHRSAIAKFLFYFQTDKKFITGVDVTKYVVNHKLCKLIEEIREIIKEKKLFLNIEVKRELDNRVDGPGFKADYYKFEIHINNLKQQENYMLQEEELPSFRDEIMEYVVPRKEEKFNIITFFKKLFH